MYEITFNDRTLYHPNSENYVVTSAVLHEELGNAGYMEITIPCVNPLFDIVKERSGKIALLKDDVEIWWGTVRDSSIDFSQNKSIYVVGEMAELNDSVQIQKQYMNATRTQVLLDFINNHNAMVEDDKKFAMGYILNDPEKLISIVADWEYTLDAIRNYICGEDEYIRIRRLNGVRYVDIVPIEDYGKHSEQYVSLGDNLLDYTESANTEEVATVCIPLGIKLKESDIPEHDAYLTCAEVNDGKVYVTNADAVERLGLITKVVHFDEVEQPQELLDKANEWLIQSQFAQLTLELSALDLSVIENDVDDYRVGDYVRAVCKPYGMDAWLPITQRETDLLNLSNNKITVGAETTKTITQIQNQTISAVIKEIPNKSSILEAAQRNASALINSAGTDGHVVLHENGDGVIYEILIMDTDDINTATKLWRWNENGFGFADSKDENGEWLFRTAITMEGEIVADFITSGTMLADRVFGGTLQGVEFYQTGTHGTIQIRDGWMYCDSVEGAGSAISMWGKEGGQHETLYGSKYMHYSSGGTFVDAETRYVVQAGRDKQSDERLKQNIETIPDEKSVEFINELRPCSYQMKDNPESTRYGFIAQEVKEALNNANLDDSGMIISGEYYGLNYQDFIPHLINYVKDLQNQIDELKGAKK